MEIEQKLQEIGLSQNEIRVYLYLLESGTSTPPQVAKGTKLLRPNCYGVLQRLQDKHLITSHRKGKRKTYTVRDPIALVQYEEVRLQQINSLVPELQNLYDTKKNKPKIEFLEGFEQVKQIWIRSLQSELVRGVTSTKELYKNSPSFFAEYHRKLREKGVVLRDIITADSAGETTELGRKSIGPLYDVRFLPEKYLTLPTDILIWNDSVALMHITHPVTATIITEENMAQTFRIMFDLSWAQLEDEGV